MSIRDLSVQRKLHLVSLVFVAGFAGVGIWVASTFERVKVGGPLYDQVVMGKDLIADILPPPEYILETYLVAFQAMNEGDPVKREATTARLASLKKDFDERHAYWTEHLAEGATRKKFLEDSYAPAVEFYKVLDASFVPKLRQGDREGMLASLELLKPLYEKHRAAIDEVVISATEDNKQVETQTQEFIASRLRQTLILGLVVIGVALALGQVISRLIVRPLLSMRDAAVGISQGDANQQVDYVARDEIGALAQAFRETLSYFKGLASALEHLGRGDLRIDVQLRSERDSVGRSLQTLAANLSGLVEEIQESVVQLDTGASDVSAASQALSQGAVEQAASVEEITSAIAEVDVQAKNSAESAVKAAGLSKTSQDAVDRGQQQVQTTVKAMDEIAASSERISKIIKVIDGIAFQTNLLALNAAVEAARAGSKGKGFAVVADEVRKLADRSAEAVRETAGVVEEASRGAERGLNVARDAAQAFTQIRAQIADVSELATAIATSNQEQARGVEQASQGLSQIDQVTQRTAASAEEVASSAEELTSQAHRVRQLVERFKLRSRVGAAPLRSE